MQKSIIHVLAIALLGTAAGWGFNLRAGDTDSARSAALPAAAVAAKESKSGEVVPGTKTTRYPIRGKLKAVDLEAKTFTLTGAEKDRVFKVDSATEMTRDGKPANLSDAAKGDEVGGLVEKRSGEIPIALKVRFGPKPADEGNGAAGKRGTKKAS